MRNRFIFGAAVCAMASSMAVLTSSAKANSLTLVDVGNDDVTSTYASSSQTVFDATTGLFHVDAQSVQLNGLPLANDGTFTLNVYLTSTGDIDPTKLASDFLNITGGSSSANVLYHSDLALQSGSDDFGDFQFVFGPGSGTYGSLGPIGVSISLADWALPNADFTANMTSTMIQVDTFTVAPLPPAVLMGFGLLAALPLVRRRRLI
ncbi:MAG: hypothetical protein ACTHN5_10180 [Phycisphaerae bacterium]